MANILATAFDFNGYPVTVQLANGAYAPFTQSGDPIGLNTISSLTYNGSVSPGNVTISATGAACVQAADGAVFTLQGVTLTGTGASSGIQALFGGVVSFSNVAFGSMGAGLHIQANGGTVQISGNYSITGGAGYHYSTGTPGGLINNAVGSITVSLSGTPGFTGDFASASSNSAIYVPGVTFTGSATGVRYNSAANAVIYTNAGGATFFPGDASGTTANGGQYL